MRVSIYFTAVLLMLVIIFAAVIVFVPRAHAGTSMCGGASWYGPGFHGKKTASGERFNQNAMTAAHKTLPFGTIVKVVDQRTGKSVQVRINDRGPYIDGRIIDLSHEAARRLGMLQAGTAKVCLVIQH